MIAYGCLVYAFAAFCLLVAYGCVRMAIDSGQWLFFGTAGIVSALIGLALVEALHRSKKEESG